jgi:hypothetical protein
LPTNKDDKKDSWSSLSITPQGIEIPITHR